MAWPRAGLHARLGGRRRPACPDQECATRSGGQGIVHIRLRQHGAGAGGQRSRLHARSLYHLFENKEDLALAVVGWVDETWTAEVGHFVTDETDPVAALTAMARAHAVYCRRDVARVMLALRVEFAGQDHPIGRAIREILDPLEATCARLVGAARTSGAIPAGLLAHVMANAYLITLEAVGIALAGREPYDVELAERAVRGLLGLRADDRPARYIENSGFDDQRHGRGPKHEASEIGTYLAPLAYPRADTRLHGRGRVGAPDAGRPGGLPSVGVPGLRRQLSAGSPLVVRVLWAARWKIGARFGWDDPTTGSARRVATIKDRLPADLRAATSDPGLDVRPFAVVYQLETNGLRNGPTGSSMP